MKPILDACCGGRMFWYDKHNPEVLYADIRNESYIMCDGRKFSVSPDVMADFTDMPFPNETFYHVVFDPPHLKSAGPNSHMRQHYGVLPKDWQAVIAKGFAECMRVLKPYGTLVFKWNEDQISRRAVLDAIGYEPLYGHTTNARGTTHWMAFVKGVSNPVAQERMAL